MSSTAGAESHQQNADSSSWRELAPRLYIQDETGADIDYIKTAITFVNYVRDRTEADVQLTITCQTTGDGGREYCLTFIGLGSFRDISSVLKHNTTPDATDDDIRRALATATRRGLVPFLARTPLRDNLNIEFVPPTARAAVTDPWHNWVLSVSLDGWGNGDEGYSYVYYNMYPRVSRVTEDQKLEVEGGVTANHRRFVINDTTVVTALVRSYYANSSWGLKLSDHFSLGARAEHMTSDYYNMRYVVSGGPKLEYNIVPYTEYVRHKVYFQLAPAVAHCRYFDTTLYNLLGETRVKNKVVLGVSLTRPWGTIDLSAEGSHYVHDFSKNRLSLNSGLTFRILAGLS
ncbi:MAG: hypothetical protein ABIK37_01440, partial [candidate division WOR-3 bacterium]